MTDDQGPGERAMTEADGGGWPGRDEAERAGLAPDASSPDASSPDASSPDAWSLDAWSPDAGSPDGESARSATTPRPAGRAAGRAAGRVAGSRGAHARPRKRPRSRSFWRELPILILIALTIAMLVKTFVVQAFYIPSSSMENTLDIGDKVLVNKLVYDFRKIEPGDIVVFNITGSWLRAPAVRRPSSDPLVRLWDATGDRLYHSFLELFGTAPDHDYIKRVIGTPGDHVACCNAQGQVTVNGVALHERSYLYPGNPPSETRFSITVPRGRLWVMGDHRSVSYDSRGHMSDPGGGTIPENKVVGRAFMIIWPPSRWRILPIPATFHQPGIDGSAAAAADLAAAAPLLAPFAPYLPLGAGFAGAIPLTWLQRRLRRRLKRRLRRRLRHR